MRYLDSIFVGLLKPIDRRRFRAIVEEHKGDAYDKTFKSWDHMLALIFAQLSHTDGLRGIAQAFNANAHQHYHLNVGKIARTTLSDANARRPVGVCARRHADDRSRRIDFEQHVACPAPGQQRARGEEACRHRAGRTSEISIRF